MKSILLAAASAVTIAGIASTSANAQNRIMTIEQMPAQCAPYLRSGASAPGGAAAKVSFTNKRSGNILIGWQNQNGNLHLIHDLAPGDTYTDGSYIGHKYVMVDKATMNCVMGTSVQNDGDAHNVT